MTALFSIVLSGIGVFAFLASALVALDLEPEPTIAPQTTESQSEEASAVLFEEGKSGAARPDDEGSSPPSQKDGARQPSLGGSSQPGETTVSDAPEIMPPVAPTVSRRLDSSAPRPAFQDASGAAAREERRFVAVSRRAPQDGIASNRQTASVAFPNAHLDNRLSKYALPAELVIPKINVSAPVLNPNSTDITALDNALLKGAARYPTSARIGENGTMIIFGHSSGRPVVFNPNFKLFNRVSELEPGDEVRVRGGGWEEVYRVGRVRLVVVDGARIAVNAPGKRIVLVTCNSLGAKEERYVVEAVFVGRFTHEALPDHVVVNAR